jgi:hypothetical protein
MNEHICQNSLMILSKGCILLYKIISTQLIFKIKKVMKDKISKYYLEFLWVFVLVQMKSLLLFEMGAMLPKLLLSTDPPASAS